MEEAAAEITAPAAPEAAAPESPQPPAEEGGAGNGPAPESSSSNPARDSALDALAAPEQQEDAPEPDAGQAPETEAALTEWAEDTLTLPEGVDAELVSSFGQAAVEMGLTRSQAQKLADWQLAAAKDAYARKMEAGTEELAKAWGSATQKNCEAVVSFLARMERMTGSDSFARALRETGAANSPSIIIGLHEISKLLSEDSIGTGGQAEAEGPEDALTGIERAFAGALKGQRRYF